MEGNLAIANESVFNGTEFPDDGSDEVRSWARSPKFLVTTILAILGVVVNVIGLASLIQQRKSKHGGNIRTRIILLISLSLSDIVQCMIIPIRFYVLLHMLLKNTISTSLDAFFCTYVFFNSIIPACTLLSLFNLLGMAIDHWLTFKKPFQYFEMMTRTRCLIMVTCFWAIFLFLVFSEFLVTLTISYNTEGLNFCSEAYYISHTTYYSVETVLLTLAPICLIAMIIIYCSIFLEIKKLVVAPPRQQIKATTAGYKQKDFGQARRALYTTLVILGSFIVCLLPSYTVNAADQIMGHLITAQLINQLSNSSQQAFYEAQQWLYALFIVNCILDPLIYMSSLRVKMKKFCRSMTQKIFHYYDLVQTTEGNRDCAPCHTLSTGKSSLQVSAGQLPPSEASRELLTTESSAL